MPCKDHLKGTCANPYCEKWHSLGCFVVQVKRGMQIRGKVRVRTPQGWGATQQKVSKKWRQKCSSFVEKKDKEFGLCISGRGAAKIVIDFTEELNHVESNPMCSIHQSRISQSQRKRPQSIAQQNLPRGSSSAQPQRSKILRSVSGGNRVARALGSRSSVAGKENPEAKRETWSYILLTSEKWCLPALSKTKLEERDFLVDSGASMHMISRNGLNPGEMETVTTSRYPTTVITANGEVQTHEEATVHVRELDMFLTVKIIEDTPAVLSLGKLCEDHGYSCEWTNGQKPCLIKNGVRIQRNAENYVPIVVPCLSTGFSSSSSDSTPPTSLPQESTGSTPIPASVECESADEPARRDPSVNTTNNPKPKNMRITIRYGTTHYFPKYRNGCKNSGSISWMKALRNLMNHTRVFSRNLLLEPLRRVVPGDHSVETHFPKDRNCEIGQRTKITRTPCRRHTGGVVPRAQNFGGLITADHKINSQWRMWISKKSPICSCGARMRNSMDSIISVQNKNCAGNWKELAKVLGADQETQSHLHWRFRGIWQGLWRSLVESLHIKPSPFRNKWDCWKSHSQN